MGRLTDSIFIISMLALPDRRSSPRSFSKTEAREGLNGSAGGLRSSGTFARKSFSSGLKVAYGLNSRDYNPTIPVASTTVRLDPTPSANAKSAIFTAVPRKP